MLKYSLYITVSIFMFPGFVILALVISEPLERRDEERCAQHGGHIYWADRAELCLSQDKRIIEDWFTVLPDKEIKQRNSACGPGMRAFQEKQYGDAWVCRGSPVH